jgi:hypothetical protein
MTDKTEVRTEEVKNKKQSLEDMELEFKRLEIEAKKLELLDIRDRVDDRQMKRDNKEQRLRANGQVLDNNLAQRRAAQKACNHRKGGNGLAGYVRGQGDDPQYSVLKHQFLNSDIWVRCLRCGQWWKPPVKNLYFIDSRGREVAPQDGKFDEAAYEQAWTEYRQAVAFPTKNTMSGSYQFRFSDNGEYFREVTKDTHKI